MAGLVPAIHVFLFSKLQDVDARHRAGHDESNGNTLPAFPKDRSQLLLSGGRPTLLLALLHFRAMAAVGASGERADRAVMSGIVAGDAADHGAFQAAFCVSRRG